MILLVTVLSPVLIGYFFVRALTPTLKPAWAGMLFHLSLGAGCGVGLLSLLYFAMRLASDWSFAASLAGEIALLCAALAGCWLFRNTGSIGAEQRVRNWGWLLLAAFVATFAVHAAGFLHTSETIPDGQWDAWAIWNLRAKFLAQPDATWRGAFSPFLRDLPGDSATHPEYPVLLSAYIARCWALTGSIGVTTVPIAAGALFWSATVGLLVAGLAVLRSWTAGALGGMILLSNATFILNGPTQYSDVPLSYYFLATLILLLLADVNGDGPGHPLALAGFTAGCAAWTKDEGLLFAAVVGVALLIWVRPWRMMLRFAIGAAVPMAALLYLKLRLVTTAGDWSAVTLASALADLAQPARYTEILAAFWNSSLSMGLGDGAGWIAHPAIMAALLLALLGISRNHLRSPVFLAAIGVWGAMLAGYFGVYLVTPSPLTWHLQTSLGRVLTQLVPAATFLLLAICRTVEEQGDGGPAGSSLSPAKRHSTKRKKR